MYYFIILKYHAKLVKEAKGLRITLHIFTFRTAAHITARKNNEISII